jgi:hypothetical protein
MPWPDHPPPAGGTLFSKEGLDGLNPAPAFYDRLDQTNYKKLLPLQRLSAEPKYLLK